MKQEDKAVFFFLYTYIFFNPVFIYLLLIYMKQCLVFVLSVLR